MDKRIRNKVVFAAMQEQLFAMQDKVSECGEQFIKHIDDVYFTSAYIDCLDNNEVCNLVDSIIFVRSYARDLMRIADSALEITEVMHEHIAETNKHGIK